MHEISLVRNIFNTLEAEFTQEELSRLESIELEIGELSNVQPPLMQSAFEAVTTAENRFLDVELQVSTTGIEIFCHECQRRSVVSHYKFVCGSCGKPSNNVVQGLELLIKQVKFKD